MQKITRISREKNTKVTIKFQGEMSFDHTKENVFEALGTNSTKLVDELTRIFGGSQSITYPSIAIEIILKSDMEMSNKIAGLVFLFKLVKEFPN